MISGRAGCGCRTGFWQFANLIPCPSPREAAAQMRSRPAWRVIWESALRAGSTSWPERGLPASAPEQTPMSHRSAIGRTAPCAKPRPPQRVGAEDYSRPRRIDRYRVGVQSGSLRKPRPTAAGRTIGSSPERRMRRANSAYARCAATSRPRAPRRRTGPSTNSAATTTTKFIAAAARKTACHPPVWTFSTFASGTSQADVPFAV